MSKPTWEQAESDAQFAPNAKEAAARAEKEAAKKEAQAAAVPGAVASAKAEAAKAAAAAAKAKADAAAKADEAKAVKEQVPEQWRRKEVPLQSGGGTVPGFRYSGHRDDASYGVN